MGGKRNPQQRAGAESAIFHVCNRKPIMRVIGARPLSLEKLGRHGKRKYKFYVKGSPSVPCVASKF